MFLLAGIPVFIFGLTEDISKKVRVLQRLLATMAPGFLDTLREFKYQENLF